MTTTAPAPAVSQDYRVTSLNEAGDGRISVNFVEVYEQSDPNTPVYGGSFQRTFSAEEGATFFPGQVYTLTLTKKS